MLEKIELVISRSLRGIKVKEGDMFLRSGRLFIVVGSESSGVTVMEPSTGKERSFSLSGFKSRHIQRVKVSSAAKPSAVDTAKEVESSQYCFNVFEKLVVRIRSGALSFGRFS